MACLWPTVSVAHRDLSVPLVYCFHCLDMSIGYLPLVVNFSIDGDSGLTERGFCVIILLLCLGLSDTDNSEFLGGIGQ